jgi:hypothetical protein
MNQTYHAWYSEKMASNGPIFIYNKSSIYENVVYATLLTKSDTLANSGYDDIRYIGIVHLTDFVQKITNSPKWIIAKINNNFESRQQSRKFI